MKNKICVYTCITGNYDNLKEVNKERGIDYYCFTNNKNIKSNSWKIVYVEDKKLSNVQLARKIKILGHPIINESYDVSVWQDGIISFVKPITSFIQCYCDFSKYSFFAFKHYCRDNIFDEMAACVKYRKETIKNIDKLKSFYKREQFDDNYGLIESTVIVRKLKDKKVIDTMKLWFDMIVKYSHRDQLSFNYCIFKTGLKVGWFDMIVWDNPWFIWHKHIDVNVSRNYRIYFGDSEDFKIENLIENQYDNVYGNNYEVTFFVKEDIDKIEFIPSFDLAMVIFGFQVYKNKVKVEYKKFLNIDGNYISLKDARILLNGKFHKNEKIVINFNMSCLSKEDLLDCWQTKIIENKNLTNEMKKREEKILEYENSTSWKITYPMRRMKEILFRRKYGKK